MFPRRTSIRIDKIENLELSYGDNHPFFEKMLLYHLKEFKDINSSPYLPFDISVGHRNINKNNSVWQVFDWISKFLSIISGIGVFIFVVMLLSGKATLGHLQISSLLTIFSFTLFGGLISIGGVKMFSISANFRKAQEQLRNLITASEGCPYITVIDEVTKRNYGIYSSSKITNGKFCSGCFLIDHNGRTDCKISPLYSG